MERLTNDRDKYLNQIKKELLEYEQEDHWQEIFTYAEMPFFLTYAFSYNWSFSLQYSKFRLQRKEWNAEYDHARFDKGIYNLDRLAIVEKEIPIKDIDENYLKSVDFTDLNTVGFEGIVLDGLICTLVINEGNRSLQWNIDDEMNDQLLRLIYHIRDWKREMREL